MSGSYRCSPSCRQVAYDATLSGSMLSDMFVGSLQSRRFWPRIQHRFVTAVDVQSRIRTDSMSEMMRKLAGLERISAALERLVDDDLLNAETSTIAFIYNAIDCIVERTQDSVQQFGAHLLHPYTQSYQSNVDFFVYRIVDSANEFLAYYASRTQGFSDPKVNDSAATFCQQFLEFWTWFKTGIDSRYRAKTFTSRKTCSDQLPIWCFYFPRGKLANVESQVGIWRKCMTEFKEFLDDANSWLKTRETLHSNFHVPAASDDVIGVRAKLRNNTNRFARMAESFRLHQIKKVSTNDSCFIHCLLVTLDLL